MAVNRRESLRASSFTREDILAIKGNNMMNIFFSYFTIISVLTSIPLEIDYGLEESLSIIVELSPNESFGVFSFECLNKNIGIAAPTILVNPILTLAFLIITFIGIFFYNNVVKRHDNLQGIFHIFFINNIILLANPLLRTLYCINVNHDSNVDLRLLRSLDIKCWSESHRNFSFAFVIPTIVIFIILVPIFVTHKIYWAKSQGCLKDNSFISTYGHFTIPYKEDRAFYGIFLIFNKIIFVIFKEIFISQTIWERLDVVLIVFIVYLSFYL